YTTLFRSMYVFFIHMLSTRACGCTNSMPRAGGSERTNMSPCAWRCGLSASHTSNSCFAFLPSRISSLPDGNLSSDSMGAICACANVAANRVRNQAASSRRGVSVVYMAVIVLEFDAACKIEAGYEQPLAARQAGGRADAE